MRKYEISLTVFGRLYEMSFELIIDMLKRKYNMRETEDGTLSVVVKSRSELTQVANDIQNKCYASRPSIVLINFYGERQEAFGIAVQPSVCGEGSNEVYECR